MWPKGQIARTGQIDVRVHKTLPRDVFATTFRLVRDRDLVRGPVFCESVRCFERGGRSLVKNTSGWAASA